MTDQPRSDPRVAVIVPTWNQAEYLRPAVESVLAQTERGIEAVIVDDGSTDGTVDVARALCEADSRVILVSQANAGPGAARNRGLAATSAPYVCFLDADDLLPRGKLEQQSRFLDEHPDVDVVYSGAAHFFGDDPREAESVTLIAEGEQLVSALLGGADRAFPLHAALTRRSVLDRIGGFREFRPLVEDVDLWVRAAFEGARFAYLEGEPVLYRKQRGTRSTLVSQVHAGYVPVHEWLAIRAGKLPAATAVTVRRKARYRMLTLAGRRAVEGRLSETRNLSLRALRLARSPGEWIESAILVAFPRRALRLAEDAPDDGDLRARAEASPDA
jgi:glycosyltransferase involved in cell wall biosynthesis